MARKVVPFEADRTDRIGSHTDIDYDMGIQEGNVGYDLPERNVTWLTAAQLMVVDVVGVGVLTLPAAMVELGWIMGPIFIVLFYPLNVYTALLLQRFVCDESGEYKNVLSFMHAGELLTKGSPHLRRFSAFVVYLQIFLTISDYYLVIGQSLGLVCFNVRICTREWVLIGSGLVLILAQIRHFDSMKWLLWFNMATITAAVLVALIYVGWLGLDHTIVPGMETEKVPKALTWLTFFAAFSKIAFAYAGQFIYFEFMAEMKNPAEFTKSIFRIAGPYQLTIYLVCALTGYHLRGQLATGLIIDWIPYNPWLRFAALLLFLHVVIVYLIKANVLTKALHRAIWPATVEKNTTAGRVQWFVLTICVMICCIVVALTIPFFDDLTGLIGASLVPMACWLLPITYFIIYRYKKDKPIHILEWIPITIIIILGLLLTGIGTYANVKSIIKNWATYGYPFSCACQGVWNTCACSPSHTGMVCAAG